jgi:hypothetical protein
LRQLRRIYAMKLSGGLGSRGPAETGAEAKGKTA